MKTMYIFLQLILLCSCATDQLSFDEEGNARGTGVKQYNYDSGRVMLKDSYHSGKLIQSTWYHPDGSIIRQENWNNGTGTGIYLRQNGSVRVTMPYVNGLAHGVALYYDELGNVTNSIEFNNGNK